MYPTHRIDGTRTLPYSIVLVLIGQVLVASQKLMVQLWYLSTEPLAYQKQTNYLNLTLVMYFIIKWGHNMVHKMV